MRAPRARSMLLAALLTAGGCTSATQTLRMGPLAAGAPDEPSTPLVTLIVSDDRAVVERECREVLAMGPILGCSIWRTVRPESGPAAKVMKIVRYTDTMPSALALEIDAHELCHVVAALQPIDDPCHVGNGGVVVHAPAAAARALTR